MGMTEMASLLTQHGLNNEAGDGEQMLQPHTDQTDTIDGQNYGVDENDRPRDCYGLKIVNSDGLVSHYGHAQDYKPYGQAQSCDVCGKVVGNIKKHMKSHNPGQHKCPLCPIVLTRADNLKRHLRMKHCSVLKSDNISNVQI
ncbi:Sex determination protein fruitless [Eumeta japonica]|uniref:Sex determination protein fruitless n=1 Tax=Eumeta variegata TaxID=151549 RepID=A0A4C1SUE7_EUMVA|nr:Sex determination protein fruitless [Eumeta japonica]